VGNAFFENSTTLGGASLGSRARCERAREMTSVVRVAESTTRSLSTIRFNAPHRIAECGLNTLACSHLSSCVRQRRRFSFVDRVRRRENGGDGRVVAHASHPSASDPIAPPSSSRSPRSRVSVRLRSRLSPPFPVALLLSSFALSFFFPFRKRNDAAARTRGAVTRVYKSRVMTQHVPMGTYI